MSQVDRNEMDFSEAAYETLTDLHSDQERRQVGYFRSQGLRQIMEALAIEPEDIMYLVGRRRVDETSHEIPWFGYANIQQFVDATEKRQAYIQIEFDKHVHGAFSWSNLKGWLDETENEDIYDIPINEIVFQFRDDDLEEHLWEYIQEVCSRHDALTKIDGSYRNEFKQPFFAQLKSNTPGSNQVKSAVKSYNPDRYFMRGESYTPEGKRCLGWNPHTLDLKAIHSHRAYSESGNVLFKDSKGNEYTIRDVESWMVNHSERDHQAYGAINSLLLINKFKRAFVDGVAQKKFVWSDEGVWEQVE